jgi:hypothetical protein
MHLLLPYFIILIVCLQLCLRKNSKKSSENLDTFWERESKANSVRKKDISNLDYITIPDTLTIPDVESDRIKREWDNLNNLRSKKILNLSGLTNTDIKLEYGTANLNTLSMYDNNFTSLTRTVARLGELLLAEGCDSQALEFLEYGISIRTEISTNYTVLAGYYADKGQPEKIDALIAQAENLNSLMKDSIIEKLNNLKKTA